MVEKRKRGRPLGSGVKNYCALVMNTQLLEVVIKETHSSDPQQKVIKAQQQTVRGKT